MGEVKKVVEGGASGPNREEQIKFIQDAQLSYVLVLFVQFFLALILIGIFILVELFHVFQNIAFIVWVTLLIAYLFCIALSQFAGETIQSSPKNVLIFVSQFGKYLDIYHHRSTAVDRQLDRADRGDEV